MKRQSKTSIYTKIEKRTLRILIRAVREAIPNVPKPAQPRKASR